MAPPRFQCLNATRQILKKGTGFRAAFSTSRILRADDPPPRAPTESDLLASLGDTPSSISSPTPAFTNPIQYTKVKNLPGSLTGSRGVTRLLQSANLRRQRAAGAVRSSTDIQELTNHNLAADLSKQITRRWKAGDVYAPHDLSEVEMAKWKKREKPQHDAFDILDLNPLDHYRNFSIMSEYMTPMGRIIHSKETGLRPVNQRRIAKAIRRSIGMGMMPSVHRHPEILYKNQRKRNQQLSPSRTPLM
ncbi:ribosomal protein S18 [Hyaloscypha variabilis]|uniref:Small ribosomal subunit protein bS18m n=1 Tax=Hyaloscypha variabilis (strain UAMH 11265 / GT02V1 / F) TaxID=1149755 RepID=A0A2J6S1K2_HYAVF|nr:ribosomal protein S18 [Hyaloscypha variabilis F]